MQRPVFNGLKMFATDRLLKGMRRERMQHTAILVSAIASAKMCESFNVNSESIRTLHNRVIGITGDALNGGHFSKGSHLLTSNGSYVIGMLATGRLFSTTRRVMMRHTDEHFHKRAWNHKFLW